MTFTETKCTILTRSDVFGTAPKFFHRAYRSRRNLTFSRPAPRALRFTNVCNKCTKRSFAA